METATHARVIEKCGGKNYSTIMGRGEWGEREREREREREIEKECDGQRPRETETEKQSTRVRQ